MMDKLFAVVLIVTAFLWSFYAAIRAYERSPGWPGALVAAGSAVLGFYIIASLVRDRL